MVLLYVCNHIAAQSPVVNWISHETELGPVINVFCRSSTSNFYQWNFANKTLAQDEKIIEADPIRYNVRVGYTYEYRNEYNYGSLLMIQM